MILFILCDACSDSIAKRFCACFYLDGGNCALVKKIQGFSRDQFRALKKTMFKGISEPQEWP